ncbi:MAG: Fic family protein [Clostridia bacterium]|nr:Fic family protein [Clostridia bacterium]
MKNDILQVLKEQKEAKLKGNLYHNVQIKFSYNTNRIEGSQLTEDETRHIFETNTLINNESTTNVDDIIETTNHFYLFDYMIDNVGITLSEELIKEYHKILKRGTSDERKDWFNVGEYKKLANEVGGIETTKPGDVSKEMQLLLEWYHNLDKVSLEDIIEFHYRFERIHPFQDGNGRVGRMIMFKECLKHNVTPFIIDEKHKLFYYRGLKEYNNEKNWLIDTIKSSQDEFIKLVEQFLG